MQKRLLAFIREFEGRFVASPQRPFQPHGLLLFGFPPDAAITLCTIGLDMQIVVSHAPVPAQFFSMGSSFAQIAELLERGSEPPAWCTWDPIEVGYRVRLDIVQQAPFTDDMQAAFWGTTLS